MDRSPQESPEKRAALDAALDAERRSQLRGLLWLGGAVLLFLLARARPLHLFHPGWWRL